MCTYIDIVLQDLAGNLLHTCGVQSNNLWITISLYYKQWEETIDNQSRCQSYVSVCNTHPNPHQQNNRLITQHINRTVDGALLTHVTLRIEFQMLPCPFREFCERIIDLFKLETSVISRPEARDRVDDYVQIGSVVTGSSDEQDMFGTHNQTIDLVTEESGFYLAIHDSGACIQITRLVVLYYVCPNVTSNLVVHPKTLAPSDENRQGVRVMGNCVDNASPSSFESFVQLTCLARGSWLETSSTLSQCVCDKGYYVNGTDNQQCLRKLLDFTIYAHILSSHLPIAITMRYARKWRYSINVTKNISQYYVDA